MSIRRIIVVLLIVVTGMIAIGFVVINVEIFNRITVIDAQCERRPGEELFTPDNFADVDDRLDTTPYLMESYETVSFQSRDNVMISAFYIPAAASSTAPLETVIITHGFNDCKRRPFSLLPAGMLHRNGLNALVIDLHNHGDSEVTNQRMTGGLSEAMDILGAWDWLVDEKGIPPEKIGVLGYSLGAATTIHAMVAEPRIVAGWSDSAFDKMDTVLQNELAKEGLPTFLSSSALLTGQLLFGVDLTADTTVQVMQNLGDRPLYIVHSLGDETVPVVSAEILSQRVDNEQDDPLLWITDEAGHIEVMLYFTDEYEARLIGFFRQVLNLAS